jgi:UDP-GlcNAc:undecaprenyl-phosphate GlcNAc-1-phosphate transferase
MHHRLLEVGHSQGRAVLLMYGLAAVIAGTAVALAFVPVGYALIILGVGMAVLLIVTIQPRFMPSRTSEATTSGPMKRTGTTR